MASAFETELYSNVRDAPMISVEGLSSNRRTSIVDDLEQDNWRPRRNIWRPSKVLGYISGDSGHQHGQLSHNRSNGVDVSKSVAGVSAIGDNNTGAISSNGSHAAIYPQLATLPGRLTSTLMSPSRLRSNGAIAHESNTTMNSLNRPSLLPGSAPDTEPTNFPFSRQAFDNYQPSTIGSNFQQLRIEDTEEFVPSYLQDNNKHMRSITNFSIGDSPTSQARSTNADQVVSSNQHVLSMTHQRFQPIIHTNKSNAITRTGPAPSAPFGRHVEPPASYNNRGLAVRLDKTGPFDTPTSHEVVNEHNFAMISTGRKASTLRPDVASYEPSHSSIVPAQHNQQSSLRSFNGMTSTYPAAADMYPPGQSQHGALYNHNAFNNNNSYPGNAVFAGDNGGFRQQEIPPTYANGFNSNNSRHKRLSNDGSYARFAYSAVTPLGPRPGIPQERVNPQYFDHSNDNYEYASDIPHAIHHGQSYNVNAAMGDSNYVVDTYYHAESDPKDSRSEVLEEFRLCHKNRKYELKDIYGYIVEFSGDQTGSRFIQTKLEQANSDEKEQIFSELLTNAKQLMTDVFGNYVIQKMFEYGNQSQKKALANQMQSIVMKLSTHAYGCRCVQKALEHILTDQQATLLKEVKGSVLQVVENQHGNHVIQKAIECVPAEHIQFIVDEQKGHAVRLSRNIYGCRIIQRILEYCTPNTKRTVLDELHGSINSLIDDQYGNYVIQCIIKKCSPIDRYKVVEVVQQRLIYFSTHKFASNVVEKAIACADESQRFEMIRRLTSPEPENDGQSPVLSLLKDQYGNYVIQTVLRTVQGPARRSLAEEVRHHLSYMGKVSRSKQVTAMTDTLAAITAGHSPSSVSTSPQTPVTPTSINAGVGLSIPMSKPIDIAPTGFSIRETRNGGFPLKTTHH